MRQSKAADLPFGTVTFLFTDIEGSTAHWERRRDAMDAASDRHDALLHEAIAARSGHVFKIVGDAFHAAFQAAPDALHAAVDIQRALRAQAWGDLGELRVRIALLTGHARPQLGDYRSQTLNRLARLIDTAAGGQILAGGSTIELVRDHLPADVDLRDLGEQKFRDVLRPIHVYEVLVDGPSEAPTPEQQAGPGMRAYLLGGFRVESCGRAVVGDDWGRKVPGRVFKCLLSRPNRRLLDDQVFELFWPRSDPDAAAKTLGSTLTRIRVALTAEDVERRTDIFVRGHGAVGIRPEADIWADADEFEDLIARARQSHDPQPLLEEADRLYTGHYLPDDLYDDWAGQRRDTLKRLWADLQVDLARHREAGGDVAGAIHALQRRFDDDPCDEHAARELMSLLARQGRPADAARVYDRLAQSLHALDPELGLRPSSETEALRDRIVAGGSAPATRALPALPSSPPASAPPASVGTGGTATDPAPTFTPSYPFPRPDRLVGRQPEAAVLERTLRQGQAERQIVAVGGPAGAGKSALIGALVAQAQRVGFLCLAGGAYEHQVAIPLGPFRDALADYLLLQPPERIHAELGAAAADLAEIIPELRYHLNLPDAPPSGSDPIHLFGSIWHCLSVLSDRQPILLCLEDLHASDEGTVALLEHLIRRSRSLKVTFLCTYRVEELAARHPFSNLLTRLAREGAPHIRLAPLNREETTDLVRSLLDGPASSQLDESLFAATEGNPLFVEQLLLALREEGQVDRRGGVWQRIDPSSHGLPGVIRDVLGRRFQHLSARCNRTLAMASVLGRAVDHAELVACLGSPDQDELTDDLSEAAEAQVLDSTPNGYTFMHALLREVLYWGISAPDRAQYHARAATALEQHFGDRAADRAAVLAHHFVLAGPSPPIRTKAIRYSIDAGRRAASLSAHREAMEHYRHACEILTGQGDAADRDDLIQALEGRCNAQGALWLWQPLLVDAERLIELTTDPVRRAHARRILGFARQQTGHTTAAMSEYRTALADLDSAGDRPDAGVPRLQLRVELTYLQFLQGKFEEMLRHGEDLVSSAIELDQPLLRFLAHNAVALGEMARGRVERGLEHARLAHAAAAQTGDLPRMAVAEESLGIVHVFAGQFADARPRLERAIGLYHDAAADRRVTNALRWLGRVSLATGDLGTAYEQAELASAQAAEAQDRWAADCHDLFGMIHALRAEWEDAEHRFKQALQIRATVNHSAGRVESLLGLGLVSERRGEWGQARDLYEQAVAVAEEMDRSQFEVAARRHLGRVLREMGEGAGSEQLERALELAETMPHAVEYPPTLLALAELNWRRADLESRIGFAERVLAARPAADLAIEAHLTLARLYGSAGQLDHAGHHLAQALGAAEGLTAPRLIGLAHLGNGRVAAAKSDLAAATESFETALRVFDAARTPYERSSALHEYALVLSLHRELERARGLLHEAIAICCRLGARPAAEQHRTMLFSLPD